MKNNIKTIILKIGILFLTLTITSCSNREIEVFSTCNFEFTSVSSNETAIIDTDQSIQFILKRQFSTECISPYTMTYSVKRDNLDTNDGIFTYNDIEQTQDTPFTILPTNFIGSFTTTQLGNYTITFNITNTVADTPIQTKVLTLIITN